MAHRLFEETVLIPLLTAVAAFCAASSVVYIANDILDRDADRQHRTKRHRPLASGQISVSGAIGVAVLLALLSVTLALQLPERFGQLLALYAILTTLYSLAIKRWIAADIVVLSSLYTLRVLAGAYAVLVEVSPWLLLFSMFFFLSLACMKRFSELRVLREQGRLRLNVTGETGKPHPSSLQVLGRGYVADDLELVLQCGTSSGYLSVLVMALYVSSDKISELYGAPQLVYLMCPLVLFWITRVWLLAHRGEMHDDPIVFAIKDRVSYLAAACGVAVLTLAV
jgi:4-hydroxybenzoate polyprenyltransferase